MPLLSYDPEINEIKLRLEAGITSNHYRCSWTFLNSKIANWGNFADDEVRD